MYILNIHGIVTPISSQTNSHSQQFCWQPKKINMLVIFLTLNVDIITTEKGLQCTCTVNVCCG